MISCQKMAKMDSVFLFCSSQSNCYYNTVAFQTKMPPRESFDCEVSVKMFSLH